MSWDHLKAHSCNAVLIVYGSYGLSCGTLELGCLDRRRSLTGTLRGTALCAAKENKMKQFKDVNAVIAELEALAARDDVGPDQKKHVEEAIRALRRLRRRPHPTQAEVFASVREVAEGILDAFAE